MESGQFSIPNRQSLDLGRTLASGQVFRWQQIRNGLWKGIIGRRRVFLEGAPDGSSAVCWRADGPDPETAVRQFLRLDDLDLPAQTDKWSQRDPVFREAWHRNPGLRILRQDRQECFFSFLLASAAPVARISQMCHALARYYGEPLSDDFFAFPTCEVLANAPETHLRELGLGFRAPRILAAARFLTHNPGFLENLPTGERESIQSALTDLPGLGPKIADCIALFAFDCDDAVPVDTHVWRVTKEHLDPALAGKSLTAANYARARDAWLRRYGAHAGWAQQILFHDAAQRRLRS
ncbi:MAG: DNA glycosylase [Armatimonadaceae bacterium]